MVEPVTLDFADSDLADAATIPSFWAPVLVDVGILQT